MTLSRAQIATYARSAGFPEDQVPLAVAVALAESGGNPTATHTNTNGSTDYGLFQINSGAHRDLLAKYDWKDPQQNANMAYQIYKAAGSKWTPWAVFNSGSYRKFYSTNGIGDGAVPRPGTPEIPRDENGNLDPLGTSSSGLIGQLGFIGTTAFWQRFGIGALGVGLIIAGVIIVFRRPIAAGVKTAASFTPPGKIATVAGLAK